MKFDPETSLGGQEDHSTANSNNLDQNCKKRRTTSGGASFYRGSNCGQVDDGGCFEPTPWQIYQSDLCGMEEKPKWYPMYFKQNRSLMPKVRAFGYDPIPIANIQGSVNMNLIMKLSVPDDRKKLELLSFVLLRNLIRLQNFTRAVLKMKHDAASKIQRTRRSMRYQKLQNAELEQKVDQL
jgi:hypothetical protein